MKLRKGQQYFVNQATRGLYSNQPVIVVREKYKIRKRHHTGKYVVDIQTLDGTIIRGVSADFIRSRR